MRSFRYIYIMLYYPYFFEGYIDKYQHNNVCVTGWPFLKKKVGKVGKEVFWGKNAGKAGI